MTNCETVKCEKAAVAKVYWPGKPPLKMCMECAARAQRVADAIGLGYLGIEELREFELAVDVAKVGAR